MPNVIEGASFSITIDNTQEFTLYADALGSGEYVPMDRLALQELRYICDQALNTSAEELEASGE